VPQAELVVFDDSGYFPFIEQQDAFLRVVRRWLAGLVVARCSQRSVPVRPAVP